MKVFLITFLMASVAFADDFRWYQIDEIRCVSAAGLNISYNSKVNANFQTSLNGAKKSFYVDGFVYKASTGKTELKFTGHRPSAGPVLDVWESDYSIEVNGALAENSLNQVQAVLYRSIAFGPRFKTATLNCNVLAGKSF